MNFLRNLTIRTRFVVTMVLVSLSLVGLGAWGMLANQVGQARVVAAFDQAESGATKLAALRESLARLRQLEAQMLAVGSSNTLEVERLLGLWQAQLKGAREAAQALAATYSDGASIGAAVAQQVSLIADYDKAVAPILDKLKGAILDGPTALAYIGQVEDKATAMMKASDALSQAKQEAQGAALAAMAEKATFVSNLRLGFVGLSLLLTLPLMWWTLRSVCEPVDHAVAVAQRIAGGDLSHSGQVQGRDETANLLRALYAMQDGLRTLVGQVREASDSIRTASAEVAVGNLDLSQRTEHTATNLQQAAGSVQQLNGTVSQSADAAQQADQLAANAAEVAQRGGHVVSQVVATMQEIDHSSKKIADIIGTIDGIAFQTNILALNAAVEAARAGEQGRGFAVVAAEVRQLAHRSGGAAREIKSLIGNSVSHVENGAKLVADAGTTMNDIVASVGRVSDIMRSISAAAAKQNQGIGQVTRSVTELDQMTQQNAALVEQSSAAAESLKAQAESLAQLVSRFKLAASH